MWKFDLPEDEGVAMQVEEDGSIYEGPFQAGERHGAKGILYHSDGTKEYQGRWVNDEMDDPKQALYRWLDGSTYKGPFVSNQKHGEGLYADKYGNEERRLYEND